MGFHLCGSFDVLSSTFAAHQRSDHVKRVRCKCCMAGYPLGELTHELTLKMILATVRHLAVRVVGHQVVFLCVLHGADTEMCRKERVSRKVNIRPLGICAGWAAMQQSQWL